MHFERTEREMKQKKIVLGHILAFLTILVWGTTYACTKILLTEYSAIQIICMRFVVAYLLLWILYPKFVKTKNKKDEVCFFLAGLTGITIYYLAENIAISYTYASIVGILVAVAPFFTSVLVWIVYKEKIKRNFIFGFLIAMVGIILIALDGTQILGLNGMGIILALLAAASWAVYSTVMEHLSQGSYPMLGATRRIFFYGLLLMIPFAVLRGEKFDIQPLKNPVILGNLVFLALFASTIGYVVWNYAIGILGTVKCSAYIYLSPIISMISSAILVGETITVYAIFGTAFILFGLILFEKG